MKTKKTTTPLETTIEVPEHREEIQAPYRFSISEIAQMNIDHRASLDGVELLQDEKKAAMQDFSLRIQNRQNEERMLRTKLTSGEESRPIIAAVDFDAKRGVKRYLHPQTGDFIREEPMQPADWQLPMFQKNGEGKEEPIVPTPTKVGKAPKTSPVGETSVGDVLDQTAAQTKAPQFPFDLAAYDDQKSLIKAYRKAAKAAGWKLAQISVLQERLEETDSFANLIETLRPFVTAPIE